MDLYTIRKKLSLGESIFNIKLRVCSYIRVSTNNEEQVSSLVNQHDFFDKMIFDNPNWTFVNSYEDAGISGVKDTKRSAFMQMINDAKCGLFDLIITKEISRFSRNTLDSIKYTRMLLNYGVFVYFYNDSINTASSDSELRLTIMSSMAQDEVRRLSERVKFGMLEAIKHGSILGHNRLYGYRKNKTTKCLEINSSEAILVKRLFTMYAIDNKSLRYIRDTFNRENILTINNKKWSITTLSRMISNPKYKGYYCGRKSEVIDYMSKKIKRYNESDWIIYKDYEHIPPIVTEELWDLANKKQDKCNINNSKYSNRYPLSGKLICSNDLSILSRKKTIKDDSDITWMCSNYLNNGKCLCDSPNIRESELMNIFDSLLCLISKHINKSIKNLQNIYNKKNNNIIINLDNKTLINILIELLLDKIIVKKIDNDNIILDIIINNKYISYYNYSNSYSFKRGNKYTRKYIINYLVNIKGI
jgi:DNA invertase Pin-like site-specific DNA recombinase